MASDWNPDLVYQAPAHPDADGARGRYWYVSARPMYVARCARCNCDLHEGGDHAGWTCIDGVQADVEGHAGSCPECAWPLDENGEQAFRETCEDEGVPGPYDRSLVRLWRLWNRYRANGVTADA